MKKTFLVLLALFAIALPLASCGGDDEDEPSSPDPTTVASDVERYCEITAELDQAGNEEFEALEADPNATQEDFEEAERNLVEDNAELFSEIQQVAPADIADEVGILIEAIRSRAGLSDAEFSNKEINEAEKVLNEFESESCNESEESP